MTPSLLRWPEPERELHQVRLWVAKAAAEHPGLERVALHSSYGLGYSGVGSDHDLLLIDTGRSAATPPSAGAAACASASPLL